MRKPTLVKVLFIFIWVASVALGCAPETAFAQHGGGGRSLGGFHGGGGAFHGGAPALSHVTVPMGGGWNRRAVGYGSGGFGNSAMGGRYWAGSNVMSRGRAGMAPLYRVHFAPSATGRNFGNVAGRSSEASAARSFANADGQWHSFGRVDSGPGPSATAHNVAGRSSEASTASAARGFANADGQWHSFGRVDSGPGPSATARNFGNVGRRSSEASTASAARGFANADGQWHPFGNGGNASDARAPRAGLASGGTMVANTHASSLSAGSNRSSTIGSGVTVSSTRNGSGQRHDMWANGSTPVLGNSRLGSTVFGNSALVNSQFGVGTTLVHPFLGKGFGFRGFGFPRGAFFPHPFLFGQPFSFSTSFFFGPRFFFGPPFFVSRPFFSLDQGLVIFFGDGFFTRPLFAPVAFDPFLLNPFLFDQSVFFSTPFFFGPRFFFRPPFFMSRPFFSAPLQRRGIQEPIGAVNVFPGMKEFAIRQ